MREMYQSNFIKVIDNVLIDNFYLLRINLGFKIMFCKEV